MNFLKTILTISISCSILSFSAQQWIDKKYTYDSVMDVTYGTATNFNGVTDTLKMDIYLPVCDDVNHISTRPLLVWIHGGAFLAGDKSESNITNLCMQFAKRGYVTASINYRLGFISDDAAWTCNFPNYSCVFATDSVEWYRAYHRAIQDGNGAVRYLVNRSAQYRIDTDNVFLAGESAGAIAALGIALMDTVVERLPHSYAMPDVPVPNTNTAACAYNVGETFVGPLQRPDLGAFTGTIEPTTADYTIKGVGNMFGAMMSNLLVNNSLTKPKPAIYSYHQPCDMVVPIDSGNVYKGLSWCMTNGYGCYGIKNTARLYGSRTFSNWNTNNSLGYTIHNEFTSVNFPYNFWIGQGSCNDQVNNPCHAYDNVTLRENNLANFFAGYVSTNPICDENLISSGVNVIERVAISVYPNPTLGNITLTCDSEFNIIYSLYDISGRNLALTAVINSAQSNINMSSLAPGTYFLVLKRIDDSSKTVKVIKE